jgi:hypothetical protein
MRLFDIARVAALISCGALLSACPKKDSDVAPDPGAPATPAAVQTPASDKAGAEPPAAAPAAAPAKKKDDDKGGW